MSILDSIVLPSAKEFETEDLAAKAVAELAGLDFKGRRIIVQPFGQAWSNRSRFHRCVGFGPTPRRATRKH